MRRYKYSPAFSLIELLVVMAIIALLFSFVVPAGNSMMAASRLTDGLSRVEGTLINARQVAIAHNHTVEVRFYQYGDPEVPGEQATVPSSGRYRALQAFEYLDSGAASPIGKMERLPTGIAFDAGSTLSSLLARTQTKSFTAASGLDPQVSLPRGVGTNYNCAAYQVTPSGMTTLTMANWFVTLHRETDGDNLPAPKGNYATVQVDPISGNVKHYRP